MLEFVKISRHTKKLTSVGSKSALQAKYIPTFFSVKHFTSRNIKGFSGQIHYYIQGVTRRYCNSENVCGIRFIAVITVIKVNDRVCI